MKKPLGLRPGGFRLYIKIAVSFVVCRKIINFAAENFGFFFIFNNESIDKLNFYGI